MTQGYGTHINLSSAEFRCVFENLNEAIQMQSFNAKSSTAATRQQHDISPDTKDGGNRVMNCKWGTD